jgi:hypothetical protein
MTTANELQQLWDDLNAPSATAFRRALARRGIKARAKDVEEFVRSKSERQVIAPGPKYKGHIVAHDIDHRWVADIISFVSRPVAVSASRASGSAERAIAYVLLLQDVFSRQLWARPLRSVSEATTAFAQILKETGRTPMRCDTDGGPEFVSASFKALMTQHNIEHIVKDPEDLNAIATIDAAIASLKRAIKRRREQHGGTWLDHLDAAVKGYNSTPHSATEAPPNDMSDDIIFSERKEAAENMADNERQIDTRRKRLEKDGGFRSYMGKKKGLKRRIDEPTWSKEIHEVAGFPAPGKVVNEKGKEFLTKLVKPVPLDSSAQAEETPARAPILDTLRPYALALRDLLGKGKTPGVAVRELKARKPNFSSALSAVNLSFSGFVDKFPDLIRHKGGKLHPQNQGTL